MNGMFLKMNSIDRFLYNKSKILIPQYQNKNMNFSIH